MRNPGRSAEAGADGPGVDGAGVDGAGVDDPGVDGSGADGPDGDGPHPEDTAQGSARMHVDQLAVTGAEVSALIAEQFPHWASLDIRALPGTGTVNAIFRIGEELTARFPLQAPAGPDPAGRVRRTLEREAEAAGLLAGATSLATPRPVGIGEPGRGYPLPWSVQTWVPGSPVRITADSSDGADDPGASDDFARGLAEFVREVRAIPTGGRTFAGSGRVGRGGDLRDHDSWVQTCLTEMVARDVLSDLVPAAGRLWSRLRRLPRRKPDVMAHGDLIPGNVLLVDGRLDGVIDVGGLGPADPALDLVVAWHLLDADRRQLLRAGLAADPVGCDDLDWDRGRGWALEQALGLVWYYPVTNPQLSALGERTLRRLLDSPDAATGVEASPGG